MESILLVSSIFLCCLLTASHLTAQLLSIVDSQVLQTYIIHVTEPHDINLLSPEDLEKRHRSFLPNTTLDSGEPRLIHSYRHVISGFAAWLTQDEVKAMEGRDGFLLAHRDKRYRLQTTYTPQFLKLTENNDATWKQANYGEGVIVGVIDTGITPDHPSFQDNTDMPWPPKKWKGCCNFDGKCVVSACNRKLIGARGIETSATAVDEIGHGTHVAGVVAGNPVSDANVRSHAAGTAMGIAPHAHLAIYKVCEGTSNNYTCLDSSILKGIDSALEDGVDVMSISITGLQPVEGEGGAAGENDFYSNSIMKGTFAALMQKDIISITCAGNDGKHGSVQNDAPWVLTVGASVTDRVVRTTVRLENDLEFDGESAYDPEDVLPDDADVPLQYPAQNETCPKACTVIDSADGSIVMCGHAHEIDGNVKMSEIVAAANGAGIIVLNTKHYMFTTLSDPYVIPACNINHLDGLELIDYFNNTPNATATIVYKGTLFNSRPAPACAAFSSRGPSLSNGGIIKPDVIAPGVNIVSAWNIQVGVGSANSQNQMNSSFNFQSGSSVATAHVAGIAALVKSAHPDWTASAIKSAITTTASTTDRQGKPISDEKSHTHAPAKCFAMGAGQVDPSKAIDPGLVYDTPVQDYIGYLCGLGYSDAEIQVMSRKKVSCSKVKKVSPQNLNSPSIYVNMACSLNVLDPSAVSKCTKKTITRTVKNVGEPKSTYSVKVVEPKGVKVKVCPKSLKFKHINQTKTFTVKLEKQSHGLGIGFQEGKIAWVSKTHYVQSPLVVMY